MWLYGSKSDEIKPVITSQNPDIKNLAAVLSNSRAANDNDVAKQLVEAHASIEPKGTRFERALVNAKQEAETALSKVTGYDPEDSTLLELGKDLSETSSNLLNNVRHGGEKVPSKGKK